MVNWIFNFLRNFFGLPLAILWSFVYRIRRGLYSYDFLKRYYFQVPIISVGNITFGGSGKTPFTIWLNNYLNSIDKKVAVLIRGYKGDLEHGVGIIRTEETFRYNPVRFGDEALLIARQLKNGVVIVGKDRAQNLNFYFNQVLPDVVVLDDGFQHLQLNRNLNIILFDATLPLSQYKTAPVGYLREGPESLKDADAIIISRADQVSLKVIEKLENFIKPYVIKNAIFAQLGFTPNGIFNINYELVFECDRLRGREVIAVTGMASPRSFFTILEDFGARIIDTVVYPDHHAYSSEDINYLLKKATTLNAVIVTSEKDIVKIKGLTNDLRFLFLQISINFLKGEDELKKLIQNSISY
ncbi:MAG: tetraacyldisaccharide 4'-kinase [Bacteriovoracaceae bacterium]